MPSAVDLNPKTDAVQGQHACVRWRPKGARYWYCARPWTSMLTERTEYLDMHQAYVERAVQSVRKGKNAEVHYVSVKDGWGPLCKILNLPTPDLPFPHVNDAEAVQKEFQSFITASLMRWAWIIGMLSVFGYICWKSWV
jgi:hypothetical protein